MATGIDREIRGHLTGEFLRDQPELVLTNDTNLIDEHILDSLGIFTLINYLEERFGVQIDPEDVTLENFETVGGIARLVSMVSEAGEKSA